MSDAAVDIDGLDASLDDLLKAADASDVKERLAKAVRGEHPGSSGYNAVYSGHTDEDGKKGGGVASMSDAGPLDDLMIGKMIDAGLSPATVADFVAYMKAKAEDEDEEEDEDEDDGYFKSFRSEPLRKSHADRFAEDSDIAQAVDASPFMEAITMRTTESLDHLQKGLHAQAVRQNDYNEKLARAVGGLGKLVKSQSGVISELQKRLGIVESTPMPAKGTTSAQALHKSMPGEAGRDTTALSKSEVVSTLTYMNLQKGIKTINGQKTAELACMLEGGGSIDRETLSEVQRFLAGNPNEAKLAKAHQ